MSPDSSLTLEGLAEALRSSGEATDRRIQALSGRLEAFISETGQRFQAVGVQIEALTGRLDRVGNHIASLTGQVDALQDLMREQGLRITLLAEQHADHEQHIRRILHRLEQHDARLGEQQAEIRRILDVLERRGGDGQPPSA